MVALFIAERYSQGGEEGGKTFDKSVYGILASNANYSLLASSIKKVGPTEYST
jgi:hypothetical protein